MGAGTGGPVVAGSVKQNGVIQAASRFLNKVSVGRRGEPSVPPTGSTVNTPTSRRAGGVRFAWAWDGAGATLNNYPHRLMPVGVGYSSCSSSGRVLDWGALVSPNKPGRQWRTGQISGIAQL